jgi:hypothetical protein
MKKLLSASFVRKDYGNSNLILVVFIYCSYRALSVTESHYVQSNKTHCIVFRYSILQYLVNQSRMFRSLMGSSSGIRI